MFEYMLENNLTTIIQFGDLFDQRKNVGFVTLKRTKDYFFNRIRDLGFHMVVFIGNHDIPYKNTLEANSPSLLLQEYSDCITIIEEPLELIFGNTSALVLPWICEDNEIQSLQAIDETKSPLCFGHLELAGFEMYRGAICENGLSKNLFWKFQQVYSGHFHHISSNDNIQYIGSPCTLTWADFGDERGFFVLNTNDLSTAFVENPFPNFHKIVYNDHEDAFTFDDLESADYSKYNQTFVKVIVSNKSNLYLFEKFIEKLESFGAVVHTVDDHKYRNIVVDDNLDDSNDVESVIGESVKQFGDVQGAAQLKSYLISLYNEALTAA